MWRRLAGVGPEATPLDPTTVKSVVEFGTISGVYMDSANGTSEVYSQPYPFEGLLNYTSGIIHHVRITGLELDTTYYYRCGDPTLSGNLELVGVGGDYMISENQDRKSEIAAILLFFSHK